MSTKIDTNPREETVEQFLDAAGASNGSRIIPFPMAVFCFAVSASVSSNSLRAYSIQGSTETV